MAACETHRDRLTPRDMEFLAHESSTTHMHIGTVTLLEGGECAPDPTVVREHIASHLYHVPRYRQRLAFLPGKIGRPRWVDDPVFNFDYHVRHVALPKPGRAIALDALVSRIFSQSLDLTKPLWELYIVEGLYGKRVALIEKVHHVLVDGVRGVDLISTLFDEAQLGASAAHIWQPRPEPSSAQLMAAEVNALLTQDLPKTLGDVSRAIIRRGAGLTRFALDRGGYDSDSPFWAGQSSHRRFTRMAVDMSILQGIRTAQHCTVTDVILAVVAGGLRRWLHEQGIRAGVTDVLATVPISVRQTQAGQSQWTTISPALIDLPIATEQAVDRLRDIRSTMRKATAGVAALKANEIVNIGHFAPPTILAQASREELGTPAHHIQVTNVPGPKIHPQIAGHTVESVFPIPFLAEHHALGIAAISLGKQLHIGITTAADAIEKPDQISVALRAEIKTLSKL